MSTDRRKQLWAVETNRRVVERRQVTNIFVVERRGTKVSLRDQMARYLALIKQRDLDRSTLKELQGRINRANEEMGTIYQVLKTSVQPRCGSATQPPRRIFTDGNYTTLIVEWSDKHGGPIIEVQEPER